MLNYQEIDVPFQYRHCCWFCGEPSNDAVDFPKVNSAYLAHVPLTLPACKECKVLSQSCVTDSIWDLQLEVNHGLMKRYAKHLGIGVNWTQQELEQTCLEGTSFKGFTDSAWMMYEIAKGRVDFSGWSLAINGVPLDIIDESCGFEFAGSRFIDFEAAVAFYQRSESLNKYLLEGLVAILGQSQLAYALRIARLHPSITKRSADSVLSEIAQQQQDTKAMINAEVILTPLTSVTLDDVLPVTIDKQQATAESILWAMHRGIQNLAQLQQCEDAFFEQYEHLGGVVAFQLYHGLQLYLEARSNPNWCESHDPNHQLWPK
ncbi:hypothetical protein [Vibrio rarus]|uniref:hypothetical protein n=1 Tax=Vibrio rarus TaxID=413403 RepID=UPI0021C443FA|nr:hypothetical protein [Vibrio rarus]